MVATGGDTELGHINQMMAGIENTARRCWCKWTSWAKPSLSLFW